MTFKDWWREKPYWLKGGLIAIILNTLFFICEIYFIPTQPEYLMGLLFWRLESAILDFIIGIAFGSIFGLMVTSNNEKNKFKGVWSIILGFLVGLLAFMFDFGTNYQNSFVLSFGFSKKLASFPITYLDIPLMYTLIFFYLLIGIFIYSYFGENLNKKLKITLSLIMGSIFHFIYYQLLYAMDFYLFYVKGDMGLFTLIMLGLIVFSLISYFITSPLLNKITSEYPDEKLKNILDVIGAATMGFVIFSIYYWIFSGSLFYTIDEYYPVAFTMGSILLMIVGGLIGYHKKAFEIISNFWNKRSFFNKGLLVGFIASIFPLIFQVKIFNSSFPDFCFDFPHIYLLQNFINDVLFSLSNHITYEGFGFSNFECILSHIIIFCLIGSIIGWIIGRIKSKKQ
jgi:hypothetical protein